MLNCWTGQRLPLRRPASPPTLLPAHLALVSLAEAKSQALGEHMPRISDDWLGILTWTPSTLRRALPQKSTEIQDFGLEYERTALPTTVTRFLVSPGLAGLRSLIQPESQDMILGRACPSEHVQARQARETHKAQGPISRART